MKVEELIKKLLRLDKETDIITITCFSDSVAVTELIYGKEYVMEIC